MEQNLQERINELQQENAMLRNELNIVKTKMLIQQGEVAAYKGIFTFFGNLNKTSDDGIE